MSHSSDQIFELKRLRSKWNENKLRLCTCVCHLFKENLRWHTASWVEIEKISQNYSTHFEIIGEPDRIMAPPNGFTCRQFQVNKCSEKVWFATVIRWMCFESVIISCSTLLHANWTKLPMFPRCLLLAINCCYIFFLFFVVPPLTHSFFNISSFLPIFLVHTKLATPLRMTNCSFVGWIK